ncbi:DUF2254 domain-containing protein [uncultured Pseudokineococcus sp.]|uniref:DUF2254 domain-containing protein n=1 Tax=uncultured Pseudokineococcus sp. TaxID=1642928 RepID=UPI00261661DA|nr:DUF2254 domain-containing protein [uncultured Pseudokineococcus sp.]
MAGLPGRRSLSTLAETARASLWPLPVAFVLLAVVAGVLLPLLDEAVDGDLPLFVETVVFGGGSSAARDVLKTVASAFMTVSSLTFSLTVVTLQLASSQYSPRLLRTFASDRAVQVTLGVFLGSFAYCLVVLRTVRDSDDSTAEFVPRLSVTLAVLLALVGVVTLVVFLAHLSRKIRIEPILVDVHAEASGVLSRSRPAEAVPASLQGREDGLAVTSERTGFVTSVDEGALVELAREHDAVVDVLATPGAVAVPGALLARLLPQDPVPGPGGRSPGAGSHDAEVEGAVRRAVSVGEERAADQDPTFGLRQLADVAMRAVSSSLNDPTTAVHAVTHLRAAVPEALAHGVGDALVRDDDGDVRVVLRRDGVPEVLDVVVGQPAVYGSGDPMVVSALLHLLADVAVAVRPDADHLTAVLATRDRVLAVSAPLRDDPRWASLLAAASARVDAAARGA